MPAGDGAGTERPLRPGGTYAESRAEELLEIRDVLRAAALTYVAGIVQQLGSFVAVTLSAAALLGFPASRR